MTRLHATKWRTTILFVLAGMLVAIAGCTGSLVAGSLAAFGAGWLVGRTAMPTVTLTECYLNGQQVDCSSLHR